MNARKTLAMMLAAALGVTLNATVAPATITTGIDNNYLADVNASTSQWGNQTNVNLWTVQNGTALVSTAGTSLQAFPTMAYSLDGTNDKMIRNNFNGGTGSNGTGSNTFEIWFKLDSIPSSGTMTLMETGGETKGWSFTLGNATGSAVKLRMRTGGKDGSGIDKTITKTLTNFVDPVDDFVQVVGVYKRSGGYLRMFLNGAEVGNADLTGTQNIRWGGDDDAGLGKQNSEMGGKGTAGSGSNTNPYADGSFQGQIAIIRHYKEELSNGSVRKNFNSVAGLPGLDGSSMTGAAVVRELTSGTNLTAGATDSDSEMLFFLEHEREKLGSGLAVDHDGSVGSFSSTGSLSGTTLPAGTVVTSYLLHHDQVATSGNDDKSMTVTFDQPIIGLSMLSSNLDAADNLLALAGVTYDTGTSGRQFTMGANDNFTISNGGLTLTVNSRVSGDGTDQFRVLTEVPIPEPATMCALGLAVAGLGGYVRKRKRA